MTYKVSPPDSQVLFSSGAVVVSGASVSITVFVVTEPLAKVVTSTRTVGVTVDVPVTVKGGSTVV